MRFLLPVLAAILFSCSLACAQETEARINHILNPDKNASSNFQDKSFNGGGSFRQTGAANSKSYYVAEHYSPKDYSTKSFAGSTPYSTGKFAAHDANTKGKYEVPNANKKADAKTAATKDSSDSGKSYSSGAYNTREYRGQGKSQKVLDQKQKDQKPMTVDQVRELLNKVNFELPETAVAHETRNVVYDLVRQNTQRGIARELIEKQKDEIYAAAAGNAKERVKLAFLVGRIATQEKIEASQEDVLKRAQQLAIMYQMPLDQFLKDVQKRNGVNELYEQVLHEKVLEMLEKNATITETAPTK